MKSPRQPPAGSPQLPHSYLRDHVAESESLRPGLMEGVTRFGANGFTLERARRRGDAVAGRHRGVMPIGTSIRCGDRSVRT